MKKLDRITQIMLVAAFGLFLFAAMLLTYRTRNRDYSYYENRMLAERPAYSAQALADGSWFSDLESYLIDHAAGHNLLSRVDAKVDLLLARPVVNDVVVRPDILLPWNNFAVVDESAVEQSAAQMTANLETVRDRVEAYGGRFCYVAVPCQYAYHEDDYPAYLNNRSEYTRLSRACLRDDLAAAGVDLLDVGEVFDALGHPDEFSSAVDNHYGIFGAYEAYRAILEHFGLPALSRDDFVCTELPQPYLGSRVRKLLGLRVSDEHLFTLTPKAEIPFTRTDYGSPSPAFIYELPAASDEWVTYSLYMGGDRSETLVDTHREELPSILIYGDSFTNAVECLAYASFDKMYSLDLRYYSGDLTLGGFIDAYQPDYVVCIRDYEALIAPWQNGAAAD